jgi:hypothetical protein
MRDATPAAAAGCVRDGVLGPPSPLSRLSDEESLVENAMGRTRRSRPATLTNDHPLLGCPRMAANTTHTCFSQPANHGMRLWRYMDFTKLVWILESSSLFFSRADLFRDPFEGSYAKANLDMRPEVYKDMDQDQRIRMFEHIGRFAKWSREWTYMSCWHANELESAAMWDLYARHGEAVVAIETTYDKLVAVLPENVYVGLIRYIDYQTEWMPESNLFYPYVHKRKSFEHEREVRGLIQELPHKDGKIDVDKRNDKTGLAIGVSLGSFVKTIHLSPISPLWLADLVSRVVEKYEVHCEVRKSDLYSSPVY